MVVFGSGAFCRNGPEDAAHKRYPIPFSRAAPWRSKTCEWVPTRSSRLAQQKRRGITMATESNPYKSPSQSDSERRHMTDARLKSDRPQWLRFRWHVIAAMVVGSLTAGNRHEVDSLLDVPYIVLLSTAMTWGPWIAPMNTVYWIATPLAVLGLQIAKHARPNRSKTLSGWQIAIWWSFWLVFGFAERFGRYDGP